VNKMRIRMRFHGWAIFEIIKMEINLGGGEPKKTNKVATTSTE
jgi:hypothetical protein